MEQLKLNMIPNGVNPVFHASQYDKGRQIRFVLDETLSGAEVTVSYRAKDGTEYGNVQTSVSGNTITDTIPEEVLTDYGIIEGEVSIDGIGSLNFFIEVEKDAYDGGVITTQTATGAIATFETNIETAFVSLKSDINAVQSGTGIPSPQNVRPISGFSALNVTRTGVNVWNEIMEQGAYSNSGTKVSWAGAMRSVDRFGIKPNTNYYFKFSGTVALYICWYDISGTFIERVVKTASQVITPPSNAYYCAFCTSNDYGTTYNNDISINYPSSDTEYHAYNGQTAKVNFGQTVYGGVADVTNGKVTITHVLKNIGANDISDNGTSGGLIELYVNGTNNKKNGQTNMLCNNLEVRANASAYAIRGRAGSSSVTFCLPTSDVPDFNSAKTWVTNNPIELVYELATPTEITTTPENLTALAGQNNVYGDTNGDTTVEYYIEV